MIWTNINTPSLAYINQGGKNNFIQIDLEDNAEAQGAKVTVETQKKTLTEWLVTGEGLASDQTALLHFGLGREEIINKITINYINGKTLEIDNPEINSIIDVKSEKEAQKVQDSIQETTK